MEVLACTVLEYILNHHPDSREGLNDLLARIVPGMRLSGMDFETEASHPELGRLDVLQRGDDGEGRFVIEAKFDAPLMPTQPAAYLEQMPSAGVSVLMFLAPTRRVEELWPRLLGRLDGKGIAYAQLKYPRCVRIEGTEQHLCVIDWKTLLDSMEEPLKGDEFGRADLRQLRGLVEFAEAKENKARLPGEEMVKAVVKIGKAAGWLATRTMRGGTYGVTRQGGDYGRYARLDRLYKLGIWLGIKSSLHKKFASTPLWVMCTDWVYADGQGWNSGVEAVLEAHMGSELHADGKRLWVPVIAEGGKGPDRYAAALERIVGILDELAEP